MDDDLQRQFTCYAILCVTIPMVVIWLISTARNWRESRARYQANKNKPYRPRAAAPAPQETEEERREREEFEYILMNDFFDEDLWS